MSTKMEEHRFGMSEYVIRTPGFSAVVKERFSDFLVNEVDLLGNVVHLTDLHSIGFLNRHSSESVSSENPAADLALLIGAAAFESLKEMSGAPSEGSRAAFSLSCDAMDKALRTKVHSLVRLCFPDMFQTSTVTTNGKTVIEVIGVKFASSTRKRKQWPVEYGGDYCRFVLYKENIETQKVASLIAKFLGRRPSDVAFAGLKDKRGKTSQLASIYQQDPYRLLSLNKVLRNIRLGNIHFSKLPLRLGDLSGNRFTVVLKNISISESLIEATVTEWQRSGFINYYGSQRFGTTAVATHEIGRAILREAWADAIDLILKERKNADADLVECYKVWAETRDAQKALDAIPRRRRAGCLEAQLLDGLIRRGSTDYVGALNCLPRNARLLYLHSYGSYLWNRVVSRRVQKFGTVVLPGDLVLSAEPSPESETAIETNEAPSAASRTTPRGLPIVKPLLTEQELAEAKLWDVVLPVSGHAITLPENEIAAWYKELLAEDGLSFQSFDHRLKEYACRGDYRSLFVQPANVSHKVLRYDDPAVALCLSDLDILEGKSEPESLEDGKLLALRLEFTLGSSCYATVALRELTKMDSSFAEVHQSASEGADGSNALAVSDTGLDVDSDCIVESVVSEVE